MRLRAFFVVCACLLMMAGEVVAQNNSESDTTLQSRASSLEARTASLEKLVSKMNNFKISGYIQAQYQYGQKEALGIKVGDPINEAPGEKSIHRMGIRRGRIKFTYEEDIYKGVFQLDMTEKGVGIKDAYLQLTDPWAKSSYLKAGVFDRPFGYEISYSSSRRESPERSTVFQTLFPDERDLGASVTLQPAKTSSLNFLKLEAGLVAGNGIRIDNDNRKDFIGHLHASKEIGKNMTWGLGFSYYNGGVYNPTEKLYVMEGNVFNAQTEESASYAKREYFGFDGQFSLETGIGLTQIRAEYLWGTQPGTYLSTKSPNYATRTAWDTEVNAKSDGLYLRNFQGYYVYLIQDLGKSPFSLVLKYDYYDPNTKLSAGEVDVVGSNSSFADLAVQTVGFGGLWKLSNSFRLMAYYEVNKNEVAANAVSPRSELYNHDRKEDIFTLRLQYKF